MASINIDSSPSHTVTEDENRLVGQQEYAGHPPDQISAHESGVVVAATVARLATNRRWMLADLIRLAEVVIAAADNSDMTLSIG